MAETQLDVLLIEDNPGDARLIEEMLADAEALLRRVDLGSSTAAGARIHHVQRLSDGIDRLSESTPDVVLLDLALPDSDGLDTLAAVVEAVEFAPIVVLTGLRDEQLGIEAIQRGAQDYLVKDEVTADLLVRSIHHAIERNRQEREHTRRREQLEALNRLNRIGHGVTHAVITTSTREALERAVCERLVESDAYRFAWIGGVDRGTDRVTPRASAGVEEGYLDEIDVRLDDSPSARGPTGNAIDTHEVQVMRNVLTDPAFEPWREQARERGYQSSAAIPIVHEGLLYGVLNVYAASPNAFSEPETEILSQLGDVVAHAIAAVERKDALVSDTVFEFEFQAGRPLAGLEPASADRDWSIEVETVVHSDETILAYGCARGLSPDAVRDAGERSDEIEGFRITATGDDPEFELVTTELHPLVGAIATHGGRFVSATIRPGESRFVVEFPPGGDKRQLVELVEEHVPDATPVAQRTVRRTERDAPDSRSVLRDRLTEKQRAALETAYFAGYFDWPRGTNGEEVADRLGVTPSTFTQHLRAAERKFFESVFEE
jgi:predicted DNA binding protein/DNA-binding NarL/FixJ family response regulator